jgi:hypothetical protein
MYSQAWKPAFDWDGAIAKNRDALAAILATLMTMLGLDVSSAVARISHRFHRKVLRVLKPAESAVRRLIVIAARSLVAKPVAARPGQNKRRSATRTCGARRRRRPSFPLFDATVRFDDGPERTGPRPTPPLPSRDGDGLIDAKHLVRRLEAVRLALADLPGQAKRLVRARARRDTIPRLQFLAPMRPGRPPGYRKKQTHEVDAVLKECHRLACDVLWPNTS